MDCLEKFDLYTTGVAVDHRSSHSPEWQHVEFHPFGAHGGTHEPTSNSLCPLRVLVSSSFQSTTRTLQTSLEHPSAWVDRPSIWKTAAVQSLLQLHGVGLVHFRQAHFGQVAAKPTTFLLCHNDYLRRLLIRHVQENPVTHHLETLIGLDAQDGTQWATSKTKSYHYANALRWLPYLMLRLLPRVQHHMELT